MSCYFDPAAGLDCCHRFNPFSSNKRFCCDCGGRFCACYKEDTRDCFWPDFTHPRWLCCRVLYGCPHLPGFPPRDPIAPENLDCEEEDDHDWDDDPGGGCGCS